MDPPFLAYDYEQDGNPFVFVSYAHSDAQSVYPIIKRLHEAGVRIWYDEGIPVSKDYIKVIARAINKCASFLVFLSKQSVERENVILEIVYALKRYDRKEIQFIPVYLEDTMLSEDLEFSIGPIQALMKHKLTESLFFEKLMGKLDNRLFRSFLIIRFQISPQ